MSLTNDSSLGSNLASVTDFKRIETPHILCYNLGGYKTFTALGQAAEFKFESKFEPGIVLALLDTLFSFLLLASP